MKCTNTWFYSHPSFLLRIFLIYVKGDLLILFPFCILLGILGFVSLKLMLIGLGVYLTIRSLGEMVYWLLQQFLGGKYRPYDYGLKNLDNNAIYILYQLFSMCLSILGIVSVIYILFF